MRAVSLSDPTARVTPATPTEEIFGPPTAEHQKRLSAKLGDPRALLHSDPEVAAWGAELFNQPRSRAGPLPSGSILDFARVHEELSQQKLKDAKRKVRSSTVRSPTLSRAGSSEREYESKSWTVEAPIHGNGGLANAMRAAAQSSEIEVSWIGTLGFPTDALPESTKEQIHDHLLNEYQSEVIYVSDKDFSGHYTHYCKTILWPIFHYQVPDHPKSKAYADHSWEFYRNVNQAFADKVVASYKRGDTIWIHDYHLLLVPGMVRKKLPDAQIGFFLHSAFPSSEIFRCLANRKDLLEGLLGTNLVAFQTDEYVQHFLQTCSRLLTMETTGDGVQLDERFVNVTSQPIGIIPAAIQEARKADEVQGWVKTIQKRYKGKKLIVARDKLDNVHGVRQKLLGYEIFLNKYPGWAEQTVLIQVATSSSEQSELLITVSDIVTRIEKAHATLVHQPLVFLKQDIDFSQYLALLTVADAFISTSLRDGMGLTAHEYVFCQDGNGSGKKHGPLLLSEFTGSAVVFHDHVSINPWNFQRMADSIKEALEMSDSEREQRWKRLYAAVLQQTGGHWAEELSKTLAKVYEEQNRRDSATIPRLSTVQLSDKYEQATRRLFLIDYEGTLTPHKTTMGILLGQPQRVVNTINDLMADSKNVVYVMSGRQPEELDSVFRVASGVGLIAENGCLFLEHGSGPRLWQSFVDTKEVQRWKKDVKGILKYYKERMSGSQIEERHCSLIFHYDKVEDQITATRQAGDCADQINTACRSMRVLAVPISKALLIEQADFSKATAAKHIFKLLSQTAGTGDQQPPDFLMVAGNDREDDVAFAFANDLLKQGTVRDVFTVSVGKRNTEAQATLPQGSTGLLTVLEKLAKISLDQMPIDYFNSPSRL